MSAFSFSKKPVKVPLVKTKNRSIQTPVPSPGTEGILENLSNYESRSMQGTVPLVWEKAQGFNVFDHAGNQWIDFTSAIFIANIGHSNPRFIIRWNGGNRSCFEVNADERSANQKKKTGDHFYGRKLSWSDPGRAVAWRY